MHAQLSYEWILSSLSMNLILEIQWIVITFMWNNPRKKYYSACRKSKKFANDEHACHSDHLLLQYSKHEIQCVQIGDGKFIYTILLIVHQTLRNAQVILKLWSLTYNRKKLSGIDLKKSEVRDLSKQCLVNGKNSAMKLFSHSSTLSHRRRKFGVREGSIEYSPSQTIPEFTIML